MSAITFHSINFLFDPMQIAGRICSAFANWYFVVKLGINSENKKNIAVSAFIVLTNKLRFNCFCKFITACPIFGQINKPMFQTKQFRIFSNRHSTRLAQFVLFSGCGFLLAVFAFLISTFFAENLFGITPVLAINAQPFFILSLFEISGNFALFCFINFGYNRFSHLLNISLFNDSIRIRNRVQIFSESASILPQTRQKPNIICLILCQTGNAYIPIFRK